MLDPSSTQASPISGASGAAGGGGGPREVVAAFLRLTVDTPDLKKAKLHLTKRSVASGSFDAAAVPAGSTYTLGAEEADELGRRIPVSVKSPVPGGGDTQEMTVPVVVVQEEGEWKIDLPATMERLMGGVTAALGDAMGQAMGAMDQALTSAMSAVGEALEGAGEAKAVAKPLRAVKKAAKSVAKAVKKATKAARKPVKKSVGKVAKKVAKKAVKKAVGKAAKAAGRKAAGKIIRKQAKRRR